MVEYQSISLSVTVCCARSHSAEGMKRCGLDDDGVVRNVTVEVIFRSGLELLPPSRPGHPKSIRVGSSNLMEMKDC